MPAKNAGKTRRRPRRAEPEAPPVVVPATEEEWADFEVPSWANGVFMEVQNLRARAQDHPYPPRLYHYTDVQGLLGIIQTQTLWATHVDYLNDSSEVQYARRLVIEMLTTYEAEARLSSTRAVLSRARETFDLVAATDVYVLCFCEDGDLLSQWRGYGRGGDGYAIGIDAGHLVAKRESMGNFFFGKVEYDPERQRALLAAVIERLVAGVAVHVAAASPKAKVAVLDECARLMRRVLWFALVTFKDPTFASEQEWRVISTLSHRESEARVRLRAAGNRLAPYLELDFKPSQEEPSGKIPIVEVRHGPTLQPAMAKAGLKLLLRRYGYPGAGVEGSQIPLRV
jgi:hypothetical protein